MDERVKFVSRLLDGERMVDLCREFGVSRKTGYKFLSRYRELGFGGLSDSPKSPISHPNKTRSDIEHLILKVRRDKPTWGPKKIKYRLEDLYPGLLFPAQSTIGEILDRNGLVEERRRSKRSRFAPTGLADSVSPNEIWCVDFKGQFKLKNGVYCFPLTVTDHFSRFILGIDALTNTKLDGTFECFEAVFKEYGLPRIIRSDNGSPFSSQSVAGLSRLSAWWLKLGIKPERIEPGHPEQNGRHERMHLTLKNETTRPPGQGLLQQQERFDLFREEFNNERPHEALGMKKPAEVYKHSVRAFPKYLAPIKYPFHDCTRKISPVGAIRIPNYDRFCFIGRALVGENVGLRQTAPDVWLISYGELDLGTIDTKLGKFNESSRVTSTASINNLSPMCPD